MGDPGNPQQPGSEPGSEPDPDQAGWAAPNPPPPGTPEPTPPPGAPEPVSPPAQPQPIQPQPTQAQWGAPPPSWGAPPPAGGPVPPGGSGGWQPTGPPVKKRRLTWLWILIPVLFVLVASTAVVGVYAVRLAIEPIDATNDFLADISAGRYDEAHDNMCAPARLAPNSLSRAQELDDELGPITSYDISGIEFPDNDTSDVIDVITNGTVVRGGITYDIKVSLSRENDDWKVCTITES